MSRKDVISVSMCGVQWVVDISILQILICTWYYLTSYNPNIVLPSSSWTKENVNKIILMDTMENTAILSFAVDNKY